MNDKVETATRSLKAVGAEITQWENRLQFVKDEHDRLSKAKDALQAEIDRKSADYAIFISQRDAESKKMREDALHERDQMAADKAEFQKILQQFQNDKNTHLEAVSGFAADKQKVQAQIDNIRQFIIAVQRASGLLGL